MAEEGCVHKWRDYSENYKLAGGIVVGTLLISAIFLSISLPLFVLWTGLVGSVFSWRFIGWKIGRSRQQSLPFDCASKIGPADGNISTCDARKSLREPLCLTCKKPGCTLHLNFTSVESLQPWLNLFIPKKVDAALEDLLTHILDKFIYKWYRKLTDEEAVVDELRAGLRFVLASLLIRLKKVNLADFLTAEIIPAVVTHLVQHVHSHRKVGRYNADMIRLRRTRVHRSLYNRNDELEYLKQLTNSLFPYILPENVQHCRLLRLLLEKILSGVVLLPVADKLADPDIINNLLIILVDGTPPPANADPPTEPVEILAHFAVPNSDSQPFHCYDLGRILANQVLLISFMDVMKQNGGLKFLQFFLTLEDFKRDFLISDLSEKDLVKLQEEASHMYRVFCKPDATDYVDIGPDLLDQFKRLAESGCEGIRELRTQGDFLSRAYDYLYNLMDSYYLPMFRHSRQYFTYLYGEKDARPETSSWGGKDRRSFNLSVKLRGTLKEGGSSTNLKDMDTLSVCSTPDRVSLQDEDIVDESILDELHDLSGWTVEIPSISIQMNPTAQRGKTSYSFQVKVYKNESDDSPDEADIGLRIRTGTSVFRSYSDFYNLELKLKQFHGEKLNTQLPPKKIFTTKDHEYLDSIKPSFEAFLKNMIIMTDLKNSELLYNFLTVDDFSKSSVSEIRIERVLKSVPGRLVKEKGQNLKNFLKSFQSSTIPKGPRPDFSKMENLTTENADMKLSLVARHLQNPLYERSHIRQPSNGVAVEPNNHLLTAGSHTSNQPPANTLKLSSIVDCITRIAEEVLIIPKKLHCILSAVTLIGKNWIDSLITWYIGNKLDTVLEEHRLEGLINLLTENIFYGDGVIRTGEQKAERKRQALADVKEFIPAVLSKVIGSESMDTSLEELFEVLQHPKLNKQLVYILLDTIVCKLFPELED